MRYRTLADFLRARMAELHTDTVQIERDYPDVPADWIRGLLIGRGTKQPNRKRVKGLAVALKVDEAELWRFLGRYDQIAVLRGEPTPGVMPEWAVRLEAKIDALTAAVVVLQGRVDGGLDSLADLAAGLHPGDDHRRGSTAAEQPDQPQGEHPHKARPASAGTK